MANNRIDKINVGGADYDLGSTNFVFDTYAEYQAAYSAGDIPVGSVVYIKEGSTDGTITALQVVYNNSTVKGALDKLNNDLSEDVSNKFGFGSVFTAISNKKMMLINNKFLVFHIDGYNHTALPVAENSHFCTISDSDFLARIPSGNHIAFGWNDGGVPHSVMISKDSTGLAYTERTTGGFRYMSIDLVLSLN